jgi:GH15 family glucan-1,4-alpha-glucosidase
MPSSYAAVPHASHLALSFGNGRCAAVYDVPSARVNTLREHIYAHQSPGETTVDLCYDAYFGLRSGGQNRWLGEAPISLAEYLPGSGIVRVVQSHAGLTAEQYFFSPFEVQAPALVMVAKVSASAQSSDAALFSLHNFHLGGGTDGTQQERIDYDPVSHVFVEQGISTGRVMLARSLTPPSKHGASPQNPYLLVQGGGTLIDVSSSGVTDDAVSGFQYDLNLAAGQSAWYGVVLVAGEDSSALAAALNSYLKGRGAEQLLQGEIQAWQAWHGQGADPAGMSGDELEVYRQAMAMLRMGQCLESNTADNNPHGQLVASLPPGQWDISWVRDAAYAIAALARAGHITEARDGLAFMLNGKAGQYVCCDSQGGPYVGVPYHLSVTRYYGDGTEETDFNADGPNIEFDNFGLFLWATWEVVSRMETGAAAGFLSSWYDTIAGGVADVLVKLVEPATGLLRADSSIWEHHWENGKRRHHTYSNIMAVVGLRAASRLATQHGRAADAAGYDQAADALAQAINTALVDSTTSILISDLESFSLGVGGYLDAAVVEAFNHSVLPTAGPVAAATLGAFDANLRTSAGPGYKRNDDGDAYDEREWVVIDLRVASARFFRQEAPQGQALVDWITQMARLNFNLVPELLDQSSADYAGEVPMIGFGAGAYALALFDRAAAAEGPPVDGGTDGPPADGGAVDLALPDGAADGPVAADAGPPPDGGAAAGCGCQLAREPAAGARWVWILLGLLLLGRAPGQRR